MLRPQAKSSSRTWHNVSRQWGVSVWKSELSLLSDNRLLAGRAAGTGYSLDEMGIKFLIFKEHPRLAASSKIAAANPCQLVSPDDAQCKTPPLVLNISMPPNLVWFNMSTVTEATNEAEVGAPIWSSTTLRVSR